MNGLSRRGMMTGVAGLSGLAVLTACGSDETSTGDQTTTQQQTTGEQTTTEQTSAQQSSSSEQSSSEQQTSSEESSSPEQSSAEPTESGDDKSSAPAGEGQKTVKIGKVFKDTVVGDTVEIVEAIRHFPLVTGSAKGTIERGGEGVLLHVKITPSGEYGGAVGQNDFALAGENDRAVKGASSYDKDIEAAGMKPLGLATRRKGPADGWVGILMREDDAQAGPYKAAYGRPEAKVIGKDKTLKAFLGTFEVPA